MIISVPTMSMNAVIIRTTSLPIRARRRLLAILAPDARQRQQDLSARSGHWTLGMALVVAPGRPDPALGIQAAGAFPSAAGGTARPTTPASATIVSA